MNAEEFGEEYRDKTDQELLRLALAPEQLTSEARIALASELARRRIDGDNHLNAARQEEEERRLENERTLGTLGLIAFVGVGRMRLGKAHRVYDPETDLEQFTTTIFVVLLFFPLIPRGTYRVERKKSVSTALTVLEKLPLDWEQILKVWIVAVGSILALIWLVRLDACGFVWRMAYRN